MASLSLAASDTAFESLAFVADPGAGPHVNLPEHPSLNWTRVAFRPRRTNDFPEALRPVRSLPLPAGQITGLAVGGTNAWVVSRSTRLIYRIELVRGTVVGTFASPAERPGGLAWDGRILWHTDTQGRSVFGLDGAGLVRQHFPVGFAPSAVVPGVEGLLVSDADKAEFHRVDPATGRDLGVEPAPDDRLTGLTRAGRYLWCSRGGEIIGFDRERGLPVCGFSGAPAPATSAGVVGLTADGDAFWFVQTPGDQLVQLRRPAHGEWVAGGGRLRQTGFEMIYRNSSDQAVPSLPVLQHVPFLEMPGQRYVALNLEPAPKAFFRDDLGNVVALVDFGALPPGQSVTCRVAATMWVADRRMVVDPDRVGTAGLSPERRAYTTRFHAIPGEESAEVRAFVDQAVGTETNAYWRVRKAHDALCRTIYYREPADESVPGVLRQGYGVCRNYSAAMESFGRLLGVPVLNAWAPRHETCFLLLPGVGPTVMEVTANDSGPDPATSWRRSRWFLGTSADEITTGVRGFAMHSPVRLDGVEYAYHWHYWLPANVRGVRHQGWWTIINPTTGEVRRL